MKTATEFALEVNVLTSKTATNILDIGVLIVDAKTELSKDDYSVFLSYTKYTGKSSSIRKWESIGKASYRLKSISSLLPPNWSTIYKLASLDPAQLDLLQQLEILHPAMTAKEIDAELNIASPKKITLSMTIQFDANVDVKRVQSILEAIQNC